MSAMLESMYYKFLAYALAGWVLLNNREAQLARHIDMWSKMKANTRRYKLAEALQPWLAVHFNKIVCQYCGWTHQQNEEHIWCMHQLGIVKFYKLARVGDGMVLKPSTECMGTLGRPLVTGFPVYSVFLGRPHEYLGYAVHADAIKDLALLAISQDLCVMQVEFAEPD